LCGGRVTRGWFFPCEVFRPLPPPRFFPRVLWIEITSTYESSFPLPFPLSLSFSFQPATARRETWRRGREREFFFPLPLLGPPFWKYIRDRHKREEILLFFLPLLFPLSSVAWALSAHCLFKMKFNGRNEQLTLLCFSLLFSSAIYYAKSASCHRQRGEGTNHFSPFSLLSSTLSPGPESG